MILRGQYNIIDVSIVIKKKIFRNLDSHVDAHMKKAGNEPRVEYLFFGWVSGLAGLI